MDEPPLDRPADQAESRFQRRVNFVLATVGLTIFASYVWEFFLRPDAGKANDLIVDLIRKVSQAVVDSAYLRAASAPELFYGGVLLGLVLTVMACIAFSIFGAGISLAIRSRGEQRNQASLTARLLRRANLGTLRVLLTVNALLMLGVAIFCISNAALVDLAYRASADFHHYQSALSGVMSDSEAHEIERSWSFVRGQKDYASVMHRMVEIAAAHHARLPLQVPG